MKLVWCTGLPGSGKSTVCAAMTGSGLVTLDADELGLAGRRWRRDREPVSASVPLDWNMQEWALDVVSVAALKTRSEPVGVLFGFVENELEAVELFDATVFLDAPIDVLLRRLFGRTGNDYGKEPGEAADVRRWATSMLEEHRRQGALVIENVGSVEVAASRLQAFCSSLIT